VEISLTDMSGYELTRKLTSTDEDGYAEVLFTNEYPNGVYIVKARSGFHSVTQKVVIAR
jgi:hypothetical protein